MPFPAYGGRSLALRKHIERAGFTSDIKPRERLKLSDDQLPDWQIHHGGALWHAGSAAEHPAPFTP